ncbi:MAG: TonB-dependent receptor [Bacteroidetes bacterium]|nr:TonB-dependent receptor [Bacteroidota bacterium]
MERKYVWIWLVLLLTSPCTAFSQAASTYQIKGHVFADTAADYSTATVELLKDDAKTIEKIEVIKSSGVFIISNVPTGDYYLQITGLNFEQYRSQKISLRADIELDQINLVPKANSLKEVRVVAAKPLIEQSYDKTVVNVSSSITAVGSTALDVLSKSPMVTVDKDDNIAMRGRQGVLVMINGKLVPMTGQDLATMLRNMSASQIDKIELITNPSAKYDAQGNSGIIDIKLKKDTRMGTNGNVTASYGQSRYGKFNSGLSINNRTGKLNLFGSYNYTDRNAFNDLYIMRSFYNANNVYTGGYNEHNYLATKVLSNNVRLGADYYFTPNTVLGFVANGIYFRNGLSGNNRTLALSNTGQDTSSFNTVSSVLPRRDNTSLNLNFKTNPDSLGKELSADLDYASFDRTDIQNYLTNYYNLQNAEDQPPYNLFGDLQGKLTIKSVKIDYSQRLGKIFKLETGLKSSWVASNNDVNYYNRSNGGNILDTTKSNDFIYNENINSAYANTSGKLGHVNIQLGLRIENTNISDALVTDGSNYKQNYTQFFPSGYLGYSLDKNNDIGISLSRRINRPTYAQLNPFKIFLDPTTYIEGNPYLKPETTESYEFNWTYKQNYNIKIGYSLTNNNILSILSPDALNSDVVVEEPRNIARYDYYNISFSTPVPIGKWFNSYNNVVIYYGKYTGNLVNTALNNSKLAYTVNSSNTITMGKSWTGEINVDYESPGIYGFMSAKSFGSLDMGLQRKLFSNNATLKLNVTDILHTNYYRATTRTSGYLENFVQRFDARVATISFTYRFGNSQLPASRRRASGAEDEKKRAAG